MKNINLLVLLMIMVSFEITALPFARAVNFTNDEVSERYKIYDEIMGRDEDWKLKTDRKGIKVYHRKVSLTPIKAFKGVTELKTDLTSMCAFLMDIYNFPSWIVMCDSVELLKPADEDMDKIKMIKHIKWIAKIFHLLLSLVNGVLNLLFDLFLQSYELGLGEDFFIMQIFLIPD